MTTDLDALAALRAAATPGPWEIFSSECDSTYYPYPSWHIITEAMGDVVCRVSEGEMIEGDVRPAADAAFIVAACNAVGPLIERVREAEADHELMRQIANEWTDRAVAAESRIAALEAGIRALADEWANFPKHDTLHLCARDLRTLLTKGGE